MTKRWAGFRKSKDTQQLETFYRLCIEVGNEVATFSLFASHQVISSIIKASEKHIANAQDTPEFIKEVDWLMNQLIRGQSSGNGPAVTIFFCKRA
jgi:hypothetical protein